MKDFEIIKITYFNFVLFIPLSIVILFLKVFRVDFINYAEKTPNNFVNMIFYNLFSFEKNLINFINFPFGLSILYLGQKK